MSIATPDIERLSVALTAPVLAILSMLSTNASLVFNILSTLAPEVVNTYGFNAGSKSSGICINAPAPVPILTLGVVTIEGWLSKRIDCSISELRLYIIFCVSAMSAMSEMPIPLTDDFLLYTHTAGMAPKPLGSIKSSVIMPSSTSTTCVLISVGRHSLTVLILPLISSTYLI